MISCPYLDLAQLHHTCLTTDAQEAWATYFEYVKGKVDLKKLWKLAQQEVENRLNLQLKEAWMKYLVCHCKMDTKFLRFAWSKQQFQRHWHVNPSTFFLATFLIIERFSCNNAVR